MSMMPLVFEPYLRPQVWGGRNLQQFGKNLPGDGPYGESWEISGHAHHVSGVAEGPFKGAFLTELVKQYPDELLGSSAKAEDKFPLLIKLLDCQELLSIQVHPNDEIAHRLLGNERGKTESWVVLDVGPNGRIYAGFKPGIGRSDVLHHLHAGTLAECLHSFQPQPGDCIYLRAGAVHAVGGGVILAEVQQTSDATFRLFDWNRLGTDGKPRTLHTQQALESIDFTMGPISPIRPTQSAASDHSEQLVKCRYFTLERFHLHTTLPLPAGKGFSIWLVAAGSAVLCGKNYRRDFARGETVLIPPRNLDLRWEPAESTSSPAQLLVITT